MKTKAVALMKFLSRGAIRLGVASDVYVVGGAPRNFLLGLPPKDIDVVLDSIALGGKDSEWFAKQVAKNIPAETNLTTNNYGVAILTVKGDWLLDGVNLKGEVIEIANARRESYGGPEGKGYKPHMVEPATIEQDVIRRELSVNTLLWRLLDLEHGPERAQVIDLTGCGVRDLANREMRCPQDPDKTIKDDASRILRFIKFFAKYNLKLTPDLEAAIRRNAQELKNVPGNALGSILVRDIFNGPNPRKSIKLMQDLGIMDVIADMLRTDAPFASYIKGALNEHQVDFLLDLADLGLPVQSPVTFLNREQQVRLREITEDRDSSWAQDFLARLKQPPLDNMAIINRFNLQGKDRGHIAVVAREIMLNDPGIAFKPIELQTAVEHNFERRQGVVLAKENNPNIQSVASKWLSKVSAVGGRTTGNRSSVGLFIPLPNELAEMYPRMDDDGSPSHVTLLYVGPIEAKREEEFLQIVTDVLNQEPGPIRAWLVDVDKFVHPDKNRTVFYTPVRFSKPLGVLRDRVTNALQMAGFTVENSFPLSFNPHVTLEYQDGMDPKAEYSGESIPDGAWEFDTVEVWGLPKTYEIELGTYATGAEMSDLRRQSEDQLRTMWGSFLQ